MDGTQKQGQSSVCNTAPEDPDGIHPPPWDIPMSIVLNSYLSGFKICLCFY